MTFKLISKLVVRNFKALREIIIPFVIAVSVMFGLEYIFLSLIFNDYLNERSSDLIEIMIYANVLVGMLVLIFVIYAYNFVIKRRKKEFAINMVLGMEKKHIRLIIFYELVVEFIIVSFLSIVLGYLFGNLIFLTLNKLVQNTGVSIMDYPFSIEVSIILTVFIFFIFIMLFIISNIHITRQSPIQLMKTDKAGEKKTSKLVITILSILGTSSLAYGYYLALTTTGVIESIFIILIAAVFVLIGTYFIFMSVTFIALNILKGSEMYYKKKHFFTISGLNSRLKSHVVGLASITMILTLLIVTLGLSLTTYRGIQTQIEHIQKYDYEISLSVNDENEFPEMQELYDNLKLNDDVESLKMRKFIELPVIDRDGVIENFKHLKNPTKTTMMYMFVQTVDSHNSYHDTNLTLDDNEILVSSNMKRYNEDSKLNFLNNDALNVRFVDDNLIQSRIGIDALYVVVPNEELYKEFQAFYNEENGEMAEVKAIVFNAKNHEAKDRLDETVKSYKETTGLPIDNKEEIKKMIYYLNGGLVFIGVVVSITLLAGLFLIMYYKQISEGYADKDNYQIMQKLGLSFSLIKLTIRRQILVIFGLPIITAVIHTLFASKIVYKVLGLLGINDISLFVTSYASVIVAMMFVYIVMYMITSRTYIKIVGEK